MMEGEGSVLGEGINGPVRFSSQPPGRDDSTGTILVSRVWAIRLAFGTETMREMPRELLCVCVACLRLSKCF